MKYDNKIIYNGKKDNALTVLKNLEISDSGYYKRRLMGMSAQEAFDRSINFLKKPKRNITDFSKTNQISLKKIYNEMDQGKSLEEIKDEKIEVLHEEALLLNKLYDEGMPKEYNDLCSFCRENKLNYSAILYRMLNKGLTLREAISDMKKNYVIRSTKYFIENIPLRSFCQKYQLDYTELIKYYKSSNNLEEAIERRVFNQSFSYNLGRRAKCLWDKFLDFKSTYSIDGLSEEEKNSFVLALNRINIINRDISYYKFLNREMGLSTNEITISNVDDIILKLLSRGNIPFSLSELYYIFDLKSGLMSDFTYDCDNNIWVYKNPEVLLTKKNNQA